MSDHHPPERTAIAVVLALTVVTVGAYLQQLWIGLVTVGIGIVGALALTVSLWIAGAEPSPAERFLVTLLSIPVAAGFAIGLLGTTVVLTGTLFPVETEMDISVTLLQIIGNLLVVLGSGLAVFGVTVGIRTPVAAEPIRVYTKTTVLTASVPLAFGFALLVVAVVERGSIESGTVLGRIWSATVAPSQASFPVTSFLFLVLVTAGSLWLSIWRAPIDDFGHRWGQTRYRRVKWAQATLRLVAVTAILLTPLAMGVEILLSRTAGEGLFSVLQTVALASWLRLLLLVTATGALSFVAATSALKQWCQYSTDGQAPWLAPLAGGFVVTALGVAVADRVFEWAVDETVRHLPPGIAASVLDRTTAAEQLYGSASLVLLVIGGFILLAALIGILLLAAVYFGYLRTDGAGFSIAATGLFIGAIAAAMIGSPVWLVLGGIVSSIAVWDIGQFGTRLGREMGADASRELAVMHTGVIGAVGLIGVGAAGFVHLFFASRSVEFAPTTTAAVVSLVVGLLAFAIALR